MAFRKFLSPLSIIGAIVLMFGLGIAVVGLQTPQDNRSRASTVPTDSECNTQYGNATNPRCCSRSFAGGMCKYTSEACPGQFIPQTTSYTSWYCPGGNDYRCCQDATPTVNAGPDQTITLSNNSSTSVTLNGTCADADSDSRNLKSCKWTGPSGPTIQNANSGSTKVGFTTAGTYTFTLTADDGYQKATDTVTITAKAAAPPPGCTKDSDCTAPKICQVSTGQCVNPPPVADTILSFTIYIHGIGTGGTDPNVNWSAPDNPSQSRWTRNVKVRVYEITGQSYGTTPLVENTGTIQYANGKYTGTINMGGTLPAGDHQYGVQVISGSAFRRDPFTIHVGQTNQLTMTLDNGDADQNQAFNIYDYSAIFNCVVDVGKPLDPSVCSSDQIAKSDIDDDGSVNWADTTLLVKQFANQRL